MQKPPLPKERWLKTSWSRVAIWELTTIAIAAAIPAATTTTAAPAAAAISAAAARRTLFTRTRFIHRQGAPLEFLPMKLVDGRISFRL